MRGLKHLVVTFIMLLEKSHLLQMRGLKLPPFTPIFRHREVASFTDAWIETQKDFNMALDGLSRIFYRCVD